MCVEREHLIASICAQYDVSPAQAEIVVAEEDGVVIACPGSGKTRTVGTRLAYRLENWRNTRQGIAVISFTNVAAKEIADRLESLGLPRTLPFPHFLGTINSFCDKFLFMPHGHRVMRPGLPARRPQLVLSHNADWVNQTFTGVLLKRQGKAICDFHFQMDGTVTYQNRENRIACSPAELQAAKCDKSRMAHSGYATHTDAMYWAMVLVRKFPEIAQALCGRFPEVMIDEFQDTSDIQVEILRSLFANSVGKLMLVGDPDQSIFGFNAACPEVLLEPARTFGRRWSRTELTANYRSSQAICDSACRFRSRRDPDSALGERQNHGVRPVFFGYADGNVAEVIGVFSEILERHAIPLTEGVILTRKNSVVRRLRGGRNIHRFPSCVVQDVRRMALGAYLRDLGDWSDAESEIGYALLHIVFHEVGYPLFGREPSALTYREWKQGMGTLLAKLPRTDCSLSEWLEAGRAAFIEFRQSYPWESKEPLRIARMFPNIQSAERERLVPEFLEPIESDGPFDIKTIHQAKGESHEATMVVGSPQNRRNSPSDVCSWFTPDIQNGLRSETVRCAYVAFTRPRKILVAAVPESAWDNARPLFLDSGFAEV